MRDTINVQLAPGWRTITPEELPPDSIPGMRMIDEFAAAGPPEGRRLRSGIYILDDQALTVFQIAWLDETPEGINLWTATFTCTTREFGTVSEQFLSMSETLEVAA